jgi:hypothetical protein
MICRDACDMKSSNRLSFTYYNMASWRESSRHCWFWQISPVIFCLYISKLRCFLTSHILTRNSATKRSKSTGTWLRRVEIFVVLVFLYHGYKLVIRVPSLNFTIRQICRIDGTITIHYIVVKCDESCRSWAAAECERAQTTSRVSSRHRALVGKSEGICRSMLQCNGKYRAIQKEGNTFTCL